MGIKRVIETNIELNPQELAKLFCDFGDVSQADFFNEVYQLTCGWNNSLSMQLQYVTDCKRLTAGGRSVMSKIGEYSASEPNECTLTE